MKVYGLPEGQGLDCRVDIAPASGSAIPTRWSRPLPEDSPQTFIVPEAEVTTAFSELNNSSAISFIA